MFVRRLLGVPLVALAAVVWLWPLEGWVKAGLCAVALVSGALLLARLYAARGAIRVTALWAALFGDFLFLLGAGAVITMAGDGAMEHWLGYAPRLDGGLQFVGTLGVLAGIPIMAFVLTLISSQSLCVTEEGVVSFGLFGRQKMGWNQLKEVKVTSQRIPTVKEGVPLSREFQKTLVLVGSEGSILVSEPPQDETKSEIVEALLKHCPDSWKDALSEKTAEWF